MDFDIVAYALFGLSLSVSAAQLGAWLLTAQPRTILRAGRVSAVCLAVATPLALLWLVLTGRSTLAMMLAAFAMPVAVESARRWPGLFGAFRCLRPRPPPMAEGDDGRVAPKGLEPAGGGITPDLAAHCALMLRLYLEQQKSAPDAQPGPGLVAPPGSAASAKRCAPMSREEALEVLGLPSRAGVDEIRAARARLSTMFAPEMGGTRYLAAKIDEAAEILLGVLPPPRTAAALADAETGDFGGPSHV